MPHLAKLDGCIADFVAAHKMPTATKIRADLALWETSSN
jgi:hypothetical protein